MERNLFKELWILRFEKMLRLEETGAKEYEACLNEMNGNPKLSEVKKQLKTLISDEKKHTRLVQELLKIVKQPSKNNLK